MSKRLLAQTADGRELPLHQFWHRRWSTKANSVSYPVQRGAEALYSAEGRAQVRDLIDHYMGNARILSEAASAAGMRVYGGKNAPYIWVRTPNGLTSWQMFDRMLQDLNVVMTPGAGSARKAKATSASRPSIAGRTPRKSRGGWANIRSPDRNRGLAPHGAAHQFVLLQREEITELSRSLPQLYRFCFLMTGDAAKALEAFQNTLREAALLASRRQLPDDRLWCFHEARHQCLDDSLRTTCSRKDRRSRSSRSLRMRAGRVAQLDPTQLAAWISAAPEPQRSALAFFYLNEFSHREMQNLLDVKMEELASLISHGRSQFQAWLNSVTRLRR